MKNLLLTLLFLGSSLVLGVGTTPLASDMGTLIQRNLASSALTTSFADAAAIFASGLTPRGNIILYNGGTTMIIGATSNTVCGSGTAANFIIPANGGSITIERAKVKPWICLKNSTYTNGVFATPW